MRIRPSNISLLRVVIIISLIGVIVAPVWMWLDPASFVKFGTDDVIMRYGGFERLVPWQYAAGFVVTALPQALLAWSLCLIWRLTSLVDAGRWFDDASESVWRTSGKVMLWYVLANWLSPTALILVLTATLGPGKRELALSIQSQDFLGLIPALMALVIARMVALARAQRDELNEIV
ncbi:MAG: hypothetical protein EP335_05265 [Alphaproteobacteria bacterium]|nr:MAG: hypothetical protein EP335_05265 [Alphaproteobacteria bacterium]